MAGNILWQSGAVYSYALQTSGTGAQQATGVAFMTSGILDNTGVSGGPCLFGFATLFMAASGLGAAVNPNNSIDFYLIPDRSGYVDTGISGATPPANHYMGSFNTAQSGNRQHKLAIEGIPLMPLRYQPVLRNNTGQNLMSGWTIDFEGYNEAYTG